MYFEFALELSDIDLWIIDLSDTRLDLLETDIPVKFCFVSIMYSRYLQGTSSRHPLEMSSRHVFKTCLQDVWKTSSA